MDATLTAALFAFAIQAGGYTEFCKTYECKPAAVVMIANDNPHMTGSGRYVVAAIIKDRGDMRNEITYVHEQIHHLQRLSNRYHQYRGHCNRWGSEREAYSGAGAYARTKNVSEEWVARYLDLAKQYETTCRKAVAHGLLQKPDWMEKEDLSKK